MAFLRVKICRVRLSTLLLFLVLSSFFVFIINHVNTSNDKPKSKYLENDILNPNYLQRQAYRRKIASKFQFDDDNNGPVQLCKVPKLSLKTDVNTFAFHTMEPLKCGPENLMYLKDYVVHIKKDVLGKRQLKKCTYKAIEWESDKTHRFSEPLERNAPGPFEMKIKNEFFHVECYLNATDKEKEEMTSDERSLNYEGGMRRLLQTSNNHLHQDKWRVASDKKIDEVVQDENIQNRALKDIVKKVQGVGVQDVNYKGRIVPEGNQQQKQINPFFPQGNQQQEQNNQFVPQGIQRQGHNNAFNLQGNPHQGQNQAVPQGNLQQRENNQFVPQGNQQRQQYQIVAQGNLQHGQNNQFVPQANQQGQQNQLFVPQGNLQHGQNNQFVPQGKQQGQQNQLFVPQGNLQHGQNNQFVPQANQQGQRNQFVQQGNLQAGQNNPFVPQGNQQRYHNQVVTQGNLPKGQTNNDQGKQQQGWDNPFVRQVNQQGQNKPVPPQGNLQGQNNQYVPQDNQQGQQFQARQPNYATHQPGQAQPELHERNMKQEYKANDQGSLEGLQKKQYYTKMNIPAVDNQVQQPGKAIKNGKEGLDSVELFKVPADQTPKKETVSKENEDAKVSKEKQEDKTAEESTGNPYDTMYRGDYYADRFNFETADFEQFFAQIVPKEEVLKRVTEVKGDSSPEHMNVLIIAMDSMSHLTYQRKLPKTYDYIQKTLKSVVLNGYNIVGDATTAAIIPLTTGHTEMELPEVRKNKEGSTYVDAYPFIWNKFEQRGYVTLYTEDKPDIGTFNLRLNGFEEIPVDHYMRPFYQAVLESSLHQNSESYCTGGRPSHRDLLDYVKQYFDRYPRNLPKFAFAFESDLSHDDNNPAEYFDQDLMELLEYMRLAKHLDNTVFILMGDHGARYSKVRKTTQGKLEERLPMMSLAFPAWFREKYPQYIRNLEANAERLTTPFDIHATMLSILDLQTLKKPLKPGTRGISLLREHPLNRTCTAAGVDMHWCTCMSWQEVDPANWRVVTAAKKLVDHINGLNEKVRELCSFLTLKRVVDAKLGLPNEKVLKYTRSIDGDQRIANFSQDVKSDVFYLQLIVETTPSGAWFESTVTISDGGERYQVAPDISRINAYGTQPHCVTNDHPDLRKFCYCRTPPTPGQKRASNKRHHARQDSHKAKVHR